MVIEMLLNNDIQFFFVQMILHFQHEINASMYIIELFLKKKLNHFIWTKFQLHSKFIFLKCLK
jgi:hypothetical protein